jgi:hypothetical protein
VLRCEATKARSGDEPHNDRAGDPPRPAARQGRRTAATREGSRRREGPPHQLCMVACGPRSAAAPRARGIHRRAACELVFANGSATKTGSAAVRDDDGERGYMEPLRSTTEGTAYTAAGNIDSHGYGMRPTPDCAVIRPWRPPHQCQPPALSSPTPSGSLRPSLKYGGLTRDQANCPVGGSARVIGHRWRGAHPVRRVFLLRSPSNGPYV